jgi:hypothetical protein
VIHIGGVVKIFFCLTNFFHPKNLVIHTIYIHNKYIYIYIYKVYEYVKKFKYRKINYGNITQPITNSQISLST